MAGLNLSTFLGALPSLVGLMSDVPQVETLINEVAHAFDKPADQATAQEAIKDLQAENDEGHARYQAKLAAAAAQG